MHIREIFQRDPTTFSFEFFPPKNPEASEALYETVAELDALKPSFVDVTYGAGGGTRELTRELVLRIHRDTGQTTIPHLTTVCHGEAELRDILHQYADARVDNLLALGGDLPRDRHDWDRGTDAFQYASQLVGFIKAFGHETGHDFGIGVAGFPEGHPGTPNRLDEMDHLKAKIDAGADYICTQLFFDNRDFYDFRDRCDLAGIKVPILAGIMPITSTRGMRRMADLAAGARFPAALLKALDRASSAGLSKASPPPGGVGTPESEAVARVGVHWATEQCRDLLDHGVRGLHFYTLNKSDATRQIYQSLGVTDSAELR